jgi:hypothetical protein
MQDDVVFAWGKAGDSIFNMDAPHYGGKIVPPDDDKKETKRTYDVVRVQNPDDEDQYVETEVMTAYEAQNKIDPSRTQIAKDRFVLRFAPTQPAANIKVISTGNTRTSKGI